MRGGSQGEQRVAPEVVAMSEMRVVQLPNGQRLVIAGADTYVLNADCSLDRFVDARECAELLRTCAGKSQ
jgi:hypothetical protein